MALLRYTLLRLALLALVAGILYLVGLRGFWLLLLAFLVSGGISLFALSRARDDVSLAITSRSEAIQQRLGEDAARQDEEARRREEAASRQDEGAARQDEGAARQDEAASRQEEAASRQDES